MSPRDFHAEEGAPIAPALRRFARYVLRDAAVTISGGARVMKTERGRRVVYEPVAEGFPGSFLVRILGSTELGIGEGLVSGLVPYLAGKRLDGLDDEGAPLPEGKPTLICEAPETADRSYVVLWCRHDASGEVGESIEQDSGEPGAEIVHLEELPAGMREEGRVARLVAVLYWRGGRLYTVRQVVWYDQEVYPSGGKARMRAAG
jgi:hypothetical protein